MTHIWINKKHSFSEYHSWSYMHFVSAAQVHRSLYPKLPVTPAFRDLSMKENPPYFPSIPQCRKFLKTNLVFGNNNLVFGNIYSEAKFHIQKFAGMHNCF